MGKQSWKTKTGQNQGIDPDKDVHAFQENGKIILEQSKEGK